MDVMSGAYVPGDTQLVQQLVYELKSQGIFDQFRKECIADVDTKPAYQNLRQRVEGSVASFLKGQHWSPGMNKNQVREQLRKNIYDTGFLDTGVERIVDQVVNPKINTVFLPKVEDIVYTVLGVERPETKETADLMPTDLDAVSPGSVHSLKAEPVKKEDAASLDDSVNSKVDEDESPPFEPLDNNQEAPKANVEDNSVDSYMSGFSGLQSHDSNNASDKKPIWPSQESQSCNGSDSQFSTVTSDETKMEICEDSNPKSEELKKGKGEVKTEVDCNEHKEKEVEAVEEKKKADDDPKSKSSHSSSLKDKKDSKHKKEHRSRSEREGDKSKHNSSSSSRSKHGSSSSSTKEKDKPKQDKEKDKDKHKKRSSKDNNKPKEDKERKDKEKSTKEKEKSKEKLKSDKDKEKSKKDKDKPKEKSEKDRDKSSSRNEDKEKSSSKSEDKEKSSSSKSDDKEKSHDKEKSSSKDDKNKSKDSTRHKSSSNGKHSSRDKDRSSSSSSSKRKDDNSHKSKSGKDHKHDPKKSSKDDHYSFKDKNGSRRSFDRDSNDGNSSNKLKHKSDPFPESSVQNSTTTSSSSFYGSGDSGNSDQVGEVGDGQRLKLLKPKFASNFEEARKLMKIRKQLTLLERHNKLSLTRIDRVSDEQKKEVKAEGGIEGAELCTPQIANVSKENWEALEAKLALEMSKTANCDKYESHYDVPEEATANREDMNEKVPEEAKICDVKTEEKVKTELVSAPEVESTKDVLEEKAPVKDKIENGKLPHDTPKDTTEKQNVPVLIPSVEAKETTELEVEAKQPTELEAEAKQPNELEVEAKQPTELEAETKQATELEVKAMEPTELEVETKQPNELEVEAKQPTELEVEAKESTELEVKTMEPTGLEVEVKEPTELEVKAMEPTGLEVEAKEPTELEVETKVSREERPVKRTSPVKLELCVRLESMDGGMKTSTDQTIATDDSERRDDCSDDERCRYLEMPSPDSYKRLNFLKAYVAKMQVDLDPPTDNCSPPENDFSPPPKRGKKRSNENVDMTNNNKEEKPEKRLRRKTNSTGNKLCKTPSTEVSLDQNYFLPGLSPAERDKPSEKEENVLSTPTSQEKRVRIQSKRHQRYNSEDLYKPRPTIGMRRSRSSTNNT